MPFIKRTPPSAPRTTPLVCFRDSGNAVSSLGYKPNKSSPSKQPLCSRKLHTRDRTAARPKPPRAIVYYSIAAARFETNPSSSVDLLPFLTFIKHVPSVSPGNILITVWMNAEQTEVPVASTTRLPWLAKGQLELVGEIQLLRQVCVRKHQK